MIEAISGAQKYRVSPHNPCVVEVQYKHRGRWEMYYQGLDADEARAIVLAAAQDEDTATSEERYAVAWAEDYELNRCSVRLADDVHRMMGEGWIPQGGVTHVVTQYSEYVYVHYMCQALVKAR